MPGRKHAAPGYGGERREHALSISLFHAVATLANEQRRWPLAMLMQAGDKSVAAFNLVHQPVRAQEFQRPVNRHWRMAHAFLRHLVDNVIGADGAMVLGHAAQDVAPLLGQPRAALDAHPLGAGDEVGLAMAVVMRSGGKHGVIILLLASFARRAMMALPAWRIRMSGTAKATVMIDNDRVIVTEYRFAPGANTGWHKHGHDYVITPLMDGRLKLESATGASFADLKQGASYFRNAGVEHDVINASEGEFAFVEVELK